MLDVAECFPSSTVPSCVNFDKPNALSDLHTAPFYHEGISPTCDNILIVGFMFSYDVHFVSSFSDNICSHLHPPLRAGMIDTDIHRPATHFLNLLDNNLARAAGFLSTFCFVLLS